MKRVDKRENKRGMEFTITTLLVIVLGILVLAILAMGVGFGFGNLWERVTGYFSSPSNVDVVQDACEYACTTQAQNGWCTQTRELKWGKDTGESTMITCNSWVSGKNNAGAVLSGLPGASKLGAMTSIPACTTIPSC